MRIITSRDNQKLKAVRKVRDGKALNKIFIEGFRLSVEALKSKVEVYEAFISKSSLENNSNSEIIDKISSKTNVIQVSDKIFKTISDTKNPQGIVLIGKRPDSDVHFSFHKTDVAKNLPIFLVLNKINNPSNLGAIFRVAEAVNLKGIIVTKDSADVFSNKSLRASMGSVLRIPVWENVDFDEVLVWANENSLITTCADVNSKTNYTEVDWKQPRLLIFGSEAHGLSSQERANLDEQVIIKMDNDVESLNLAVACGVVLFEAKRQFDYKT